MAVCEGRRSPVGVRRASLWREGGIVDDVASVGGQADAVHRLEVAAAGLRELPRHAADLQIGRTSLWGMQQ